MLEIVGDQIVLQEFTEQHLNNPLYFQWLRDLDIVKNIYRIDYLMPMQKEKINKHVNDLMISEQDCFFAIIEKVSNEFIGTIKLGHINWRSGIADVGIMIGHKSYRGKGLSEEVVSMVCNYAFNILSLRKLTGGTSADNIPMRKCFEKVGFKQEGILRQQLLISGKYIDHVLYGIFTNEYFKEKEVK